MFTYDCLRWLQYILAYSSSPRAFLIKDRSFSTTIPWPNSDTLKILPYLNAHLSKLRCIFSILTSSEDPESGKPFGPGICLPGILFPVKCLYAAIKSKTVIASTSNPASIFVCICKRRQKIIGYPYETEENYIVAYFIV